MKKKTFRAFIVLVILAVIAAIGIAGFSIYRRYQQQRTASVDQVSVSKDTDHHSVEKPADSEIQDETGDEDQAEEELPSAGIPEDSYFEIDFFDVGEADSTLVKCDGHTMLIDGGNPGASRFLYAYLEQNGIDYLDYIICTHAHEDHVGGLAGALNYATVGTAFCPVTEYDTRAFRSFVKYLNKQGKDITVPVAGESFMLGNATVEIVGPVDMSLAEDNPNNSCVVTRILYGDTSFLITGDAEEIEEQSILDAGFDVKSTVLRVAHHGSHTSTSERFLKAVAPEYCVISVGEDNSYGHPHDEVIERISDYGATILRTDLSGDIICTSDGKNISFRTEK